MNTQGSFRFLVGTMLMYGTAGHEQTMQLTHYLLFLLGLFLMFWAGVNRQGVTLHWPYPRVRVHHGWKYTQEQRWPS